MNTTHSQTPPPSPRQKRIRDQDEALAAILARDVFQRERYYVLTRVVMALSGAVIVLAVLVFVMMLRPPQERYFLTDDQGRLTPVVPVNAPIDTNAIVAQWMLQATIQAYTYDFSNYKAEFNAAEQNFTAEGWLGFKDGLLKSGDLQSVVDNKYVVSAVATGAPELENPPTTNANGVYEWVFQFPITVTYQSSEESSSNQYIATVTVDRVSEADNPRGLGIEKIILQ